MSLFCVLCHLMTNNWHFHSKVKKPKQLAANHILALEKLIVFWNTSFTKFYKLREVTSQKIDWNRIEIFTEHVSNLNFNFLWSMRYNGINFRGFANKRKDLCKSDIIWTENLVTYSNKCWNSVICNDKFLRL